MVRRRGYKVGGAERPLHFWRIKYAPKLSFTAREGGGIMNTMEKQAREKRGIGSGLSLCFCLNRTSSR